MPGLALQKDIAALLTAEVALDPITVTAGGGTDGVEQDGIAVDRFDIQQNAATDDRRRGLTAGLFIGITTTLGAGESMTLIANAQDADDLAFTLNVDDFDHRASAQPPAITLPTLVITDAGVLTDERQTLKQQYDLDGARQFIRCQYTITMSAGAADTALSQGLWVFGGAQSNPFESGLRGSWAAMQ